MTCKMWRCSAEVYAAGLCREHYQIDRKRRKRDEQLQRETAEHAGAITSVEDLQKAIATGDAAGVESYLAWSCSVRGCPGCPQATAARLLVAEVRRLREDLKKIEAAYETNVGHPFFVGPPYDDGGSGG